MSKYYMILPLAAASHRLSLCSEINGASMWDPMEAQSLFIKKKVKIKKNNQDFKESEIILDCNVFFLS